MEISIEKQARVILEQKINELNNAGFIVKKPVIEIQSSHSIDNEDSLNLVVKINVEMFVPDKFIRVEL